MDKGIQDTRTAQAKAWRLRSAEEILLALRLHKLAEAGPSNRGHTEEAQMLLRSMTSAWYPGLCRVGLIVPLLLENQGLSSDIC